MRLKVLAAEWGVGLPEVVDRLVAEAGLVGERFRVEALAPRVAGDLAQRASQGAQVSAIVEEDEQASALARLRAQIAQVFPSPTQCHDSATRVEVEPAPSDLRYVSEDELWTEPRPVPPRRTR